MMNNLINKQLPNDPKLILLNKELVKRRIVPIGLTLRFHLLLGCNANCLMCDLYDSRYVPSDQTYDRIIRLLDFVDTKTVAKINLDGVSEPLLDKQGLIRFMQKAIGKGFGFCFTTNATYLTEDYLDLLIENGLSEINISLDSAVPKIHDAIRAVKGLGSSILSVLRYAKRKYPSFKITILTTIMTINTDSIQGLVALANELDLNALHFSSIDERNKNFQRLKLTDNDLEKIELIKKSEMVQRSKVPIIWDFCMQNHPQASDNRYCKLVIIETGEISLPARHAPNKKYILDKPLRTMLQDEELRGYLWG